MVHSLPTLTKKHPSEIVLKLQHFPLSLYRLKKEYFVAKHLAKIKFSGILIDFPTRRM